MARPSRHPRWRWVRRGLLAGVLLVAAWVGVQVWNGVRAGSDLRAAQQDLQRALVALHDDDPAVRDDALRLAADHARAARDRTDGPGWAAVTLLPGIGDDADGVRALSRSLAELGDRGLPSLVRAVDGLRGLVRDGGVDLDRLAVLTPAVTRAEDSFRAAADDVGDQDSAGLLDPLRVRFDEYRTQTTELATDLASATTATEVLPDVLGASGPRDYLFTFQNNAELRATGGVAGSWAVIHADAGRLSIVQQGSAGDFPARRRPVIPLTDEETAIYGPELGRFFQDANFTPEFSRAAELWAAHYERRYPGTPLDGVVSLDVVGLSYLLRGTGPVQVGLFTLTADNAVPALLSDIYATIPDPAAQDTAFQLVARSVFEALTTGIASPEALSRGLARATEEGRLRFALFDDADAGRLAGAAVLGELDPDATVVSFDDATGSKMSYYLRVAGPSAARAGAMELRQTISPDRAGGLSGYVTGGGRYGTTAGSQRLFVRLYSPVGGTIDEAAVAGERLRPLVVLTWKGREVVTVPVLLDGRPRALLLTWSARGGSGVTVLTPGLGVPTTKRC